MKRLACSLGLILQKDEAGEVRAWGREEEEVPGFLQFAFVGFKKLQIKSNIFTLSDFIPIFQRASHNIMENTMNWQKGSSAEIMRHELFFVTCQPNYCGMLLLLSLSHYLIHEKPTWNSWFWFIPNNNIRIWFRFDSPGLHINRPFISADVIGLGLFILIRSQYYYVKGKSELSLSPWTWFVKSVQWSICLTLWVMSLAKTTNWERTNACYEGCEVLDCPGQNIQFPQIEHSIPPDLENLTICSETPSITFFKEIPGQTTQQ